MTALPSDSYLLAWVREALRLYHAALPTASETQRLVWQYCSPMKFTEAAWPYYEPGKAAAVVNIALISLIAASSVKPEDALARAKQWVLKNWQPQPTR